MTQPLTKIVYLIKRTCENCGHTFNPVRRDTYCLQCRQHHNQYLDYISMARGIGKRPVILPVSLRSYLYEASNCNVGK